MPTVEECRQALATLTARLTELDAADQAAYFAGRTFSCRVPDLGVVFVTRFGRDDPAGNGSGQEGAAVAVRLAGPDEQPADVRFTADSATVVELAGDLRGFPRALLTGRVKVQAGVRDLLRLRKLR